MARHLRRLVHDERGLTLPETIVTLVVSSTILLGLGSAFLTGWRAFETAERASRIESEVERIRLQFLDDVRSAARPKRPETALTITRVEQCASACNPQAGQATSGRRLVLGTYDSKLSQLRVVTWTYDLDAGTLTRQVTVGNAAPQPARTLGSSLSKAFTANATISFPFTIEADAATVTLALPYPPFNSDGTASPVRTIRAVMRGTAQ